MFYCLICNRKYKNPQSYNDHLTRKYHKINLMKLELLYSQNPDSNAYKQWKLNLEMFDKKKEIKKQKETENN